jgi:opacity protein-like surface antigen
MSRQRTAVTARLLAGAALAALTMCGLACGPATAGVLDPAPAYPARTPNNQPGVYDWTGFYVGLSGGATWGNAKWESDPDATAGTVSGGSGLIGGTIGYNMQNFGPLVVGEEFDFSWRKFDFTIPAATCMPNCSLTSDWISTARLRFGLPIDRFLPYVTGGLSMSNFVAGAAGQPFGPVNTTTFNWTAGAGIEFLISGPWTGKLEYLYVNHTRFACVQECNAPAGAAVNFGVNENIFRVGFNYRLGGW